MLHEHPGRPSLQARRKYRVRQLWVEFIQNGLSENHEILYIVIGDS